MAKGKAPASLQAPAEAEAAAATSAPAAAAASAAPPPPPRRRSLFARLFFRRRRKSNSSGWNPKKIAAANPPERDIVLSVPVASSSSEGGGGGGAAAKAKEGASSTAIEHGGGGETVVRICRVGAAVRSLVLPDGTDIVLGSDETLPYLDGSLPYFGVVVGRVANRISGARFSLPDGAEVVLPANDNGRHCLHGGEVGWDKREWTDEGEGGGKGASQQQQSSSSPSTSSSSRRRSSALLSLLSEDGDQGFPGNVRAEVLYELLPGGKALRMTFTATTDKPTAVAMTQHSYFNLDGGGTGAGAGAGVEEAEGKKKKKKESKKELSTTILDHSLQIDASHYLPKNAETGVPDGTRAPVAGTFLDFRKPKRIGEGSAFLSSSSSGGNPEEGEPGSAFAGGRRGFDDCFAVDGYKGPGVVRRAAVLSSSSSPSSGSESEKGKKKKKTLEVWTDARGIQFYSAGFCGDPMPVRGKRGMLHGPFAGAALETHAFPNGVNATEGGAEEVEAWKRDMVLMPGREYKHVVEWRFSW